MVCCVGPGALPPSLPRGILGSSEYSGVRTNGYEILVIDDHPNNLYLVRSFLTQQGFKVRLATNGSMGLASAQSSQPDLILLDVNMEDMSGYEVCRQLKENPSTRPIPVIFLSAMHQTFDKIEAFSVGAVDYVTKPFEEAELLARLNTHLTINRLQQELFQTNLHLENKVRDFACVIRADQILGSETQEKKLLVTLMDLTRDNTGADKGVVVIQREGQWFIEAKISQGPVQAIGSNSPLLAKMPLGTLPKELIDKVIASKDIMVLQNEEDFKAVCSADGYIKHQQPHSGLVVPLLNRGNLLGVLYLEDSHTDGRFTQNRVEIVQLLCSQAAIAIQNARLYAGLEHQVEKRTQDLRHLYRYHETILRSAGEGIYGIDMEGKLTFMNPAAMHLLGYTLPELLHQSIHAITHYQHPDGSPYPQEDCSIEAVLKDGVTRSSDHEALLRKDGTSFPVECTSTAIQEEWGQITGAVIVFKDITERKRAEHEVLSWSKALEQSNQELDEFSYSASHDLMEPLRGVKNYVNLLTQEYGSVLDSKGKALCDTITSLTVRMETLLSSLLHYSRAGGTELVLRDIDLDHLLSDVLVILKPRLTQQHIEIRRPAPLPTQPCDEVRMGEIFQNLLTNAIKYNDKEHKWIEIGFRDASSPEELALWQTSRAFYVRDNGIGIASKHHTAIFRLFRRLHGREKYGGGIGAGLTITKKIIERHGGQLWVESTINEGSTFWFTLQPEKPPHRPTPEAPSPHSP